MVRVRSQPDNAKGRNPAIEQLLLVFEFLDRFSQSPEISGLCKREFDYGRGGLTSVLLPPGERTYDHANDSDDSDDDQTKFTTPGPFARSKAIVIGSAGGLEKRRKEKMRW